MSSSETIETLQAEIRRLQQTIADFSQTHASVTDVKYIYYEAFYHIPDAITIISISPDWKEFRALSNPASRRTLGMQSPEGPLHNQEFDSHTVQFAEDSMAIAMNRLRTCLEQQTALEVEDHLVVNERDIWMRSTFVPLPTDERGKFRVLIAGLDITEQKKREQKELKAREMVIEQQMAALSELSTPLLAISDDVVVLPLIGAIDSRRAQQIMEALLLGISRNGAKYAILDITGVPLVDTQVANVLIQATQAVRLLGSKVILTGIRPEVAQTLVGLGIDLGGITTHSTLQAGITSSLARPTKAVP